MNLIMRNTPRVVIAVLILALGTLIPAQAAEPDIPAAAKAEMDAGTAAIRSNDWAAAVEHLSRAAELAPRNLKVQQTFILYHRAGNLRTLSREESEKRFEALRARYQRMAKKEPTNPLWQILLGSVQFYEDPHASQRAYERAVELDPTQVEPLQMLGVIATTRGENDLARRYYERAAAAAPDDPKAAGALVGISRDQGYEAFQEAAMDLIGRFPDSSEAVKWYYWLGIDAESPAEKQRVWQEAIDRYPLETVAEEQSGWLSSIYGAMFRFLQKNDSLEAQRFARDAVDRFAGTDSAKTWFTRYRQQSEFNVAVAAIEVGENDAALELLGNLEETVSKRDELRESIAYRKALAQSAKGEFEAALEALLQILKENPNPIFEQAYYRTAAAAGIEDADAENRIWEARLSEAAPFQDFTLKDPDGNVVRLSDHRGKIVLVNFWYPSCGPCRGEFPHLQKIVERFRGRGFSVLALNTHPNEADKVKPFLESNRYDFLAVETPGEDWSKEVYGVVGTPANFLLDREGRVVARPRLHDAETEQRLTLLIEALLEREG